MFNLAHIHPMLVHFPLVLIPLALILELWVVKSGNSLFGRDCHSREILVLILLGAVAALAAAAFGDMALDIAIDNGVPDAKLENHEDLGTTSAWLIVTLAVLQSWFYRRQTESRGISLAMTGATLGITLLLLTTAFFGGELVYQLGVNVG